MPTLEEISQTPKDINNWFLSISSHIAEARRVVEELSLQDPPTEPFKSKYAGRNMLKSALERAQSFEPYTDQEISRVRLAQATIFYYTGQVSVEVEEPQEAIKSFTSALEILGLEPVSKYNLSLRLHLHNVMATLWSGRGEHNKAYELLEKAKELHAEYLHAKQPPPCSYDEIFMDEEFTEEERNTMFEKIYTNTLFYLAQVYGVRGDNRQAAAHCHITLQRQLEADDFDPLDWSLNCATLSQYYITMNNYQSARHTLACASSVISNVEESSAGVSGYSDEEYDSEKIKKTRADIERCWVKYCVNLLKDSVKEAQDSDISEKPSKISEMKKNFEEEEEEEEKKEEEKEEGKDGENKDKDEKKEKDKEDNSTSEEINEEEERKMKGFSDLVDVDDIELLRITNVETGQYEELVGVDLCSTYEEARRVFKAGSKFTENAVKYYTFDEHVTDHVEIRQDLSTIYKCLAHFDEDESRQCKMHKRRIDILTELTSPLNIQHFRMICRQLRFELGEARNTMVSLKYSIAAEQPPEKQNWKKINNLCFAAIQEFQRFIDLLRDPSDNFPDVLAEDTVRPYIISQIYIARMYGKIKPMDAQQKIMFLGKATEHFNAAVSYYDKNGCEGVKDEIDVAREMVHFLPAKIEKIKRMEHGQI